MAENLNFDAPGSVCYNNNPDNCDIYGKLYDWTTIMQGANASDAVPSGVRGVCPKGWHLPSKGEFQALIDFLGGTTKAGAALKSTSSLWDIPNTGATNSSGFSALPAGEYNSVYNELFSHLGQYSSFWSTTHNPAQPPVPNAFLYLGLSKDNTKALIMNNGKEVGMSCRCVKD
jgi:uncharacterized protein (TIGR02145 family)